MYQHRHVPSVWSFTDSTSIKMKVHSKSGGNDEPRVKKKKKNTLLIGLNYISGISLLFYPLPLFISREMNSLQRWLSVLVFEL